MRSGRPATSARQPPVRGAPLSLRTSPRRAPSPRRSRALPTLPLPPPRASLLLALPMTPPATAPGAACAAPSRAGTRARARARTPPPPGPRPSSSPSVASRLSRRPSPLGRRPPLSLAPPMPPRAAGTPTRAPCSTSSTRTRGAPCRSISAPRRSSGSSRSRSCSAGRLDQPGTSPASASSAPSLRPREAHRELLLRPRDATPGGDRVRSDGILRRGGGVPRSLIYNNWSYVRDRLLSATVEYEETGWYDGQTYVKDPEMLEGPAPGTYTVRPIVERLRKTLLARVRASSPLAALSYIAPARVRMGGTITKTAVRGSRGRPRTSTNRNSARRRRRRRRRRSSRGTRGRWERDRSDQASEGGGPRGGERGVIRAFVLSRAI